MLRFDTPPAHLRTAAFVEGLSFLLLLLVAMPLKYLADLPLAVRIVGSLHGGLFVWLAVLVLLGVVRRGKALAWGAKIMLASLIPFGTFVIDAALLREVEEFDANPTP